MGPGSIEDRESLPSRTERMEDVYKELVSGISEAASFDDLNNIYSKAMKAIGGLQKEAEAEEEELDLTFKNGTDFSELKAGIAEYKTAKADYETIDKFTSDHKRSAIMDRYQSAQGKLPDDIQGQVDRLVGVMLSQPEPEIDEV